MRLPPISPWRFTRFSVSCITLPPKVPPPCSLFPDICSSRRCRASSRVPPRQSGSWPPGGTRRGTRGWIHPRPLFWFPTTSRGTILSLPRPCSTSSATRRPGCNNLNGSEKGAAECTAMSRGTASVRIRRHLSVRTGIVYLSRKGPSRPPESGRRIPPPL